MISTVLQYAYNNGICALFLRVLGIRSWRTTMTCWKYFFQGVGKVGRHGTSLKSAAVAKVCADAKKIRMFLTVPEWWGGGAVYYLNEQIKTFEKGLISLVVSPAGFGRVLTVRLYDGPQMMQRFYINSLSALHHLPQGRVEDVVVSTIVSWHDVVGQRRIDQTGIAELMRQILAIKHANKCKLLYLLHDYYCVCPRLFLVGDDGQYCKGEFTGEKCNECCARDVNCADQIAGGTDVMKWRKTMEDFLDEADEIRAFCADTVDRMKKVFPQFSYTLVPHREPEAIRRQPKVLYEKLHVGLIGNISQYKGVGEIYVLAQWLQKNFPDERLTIIGNWCDARPCPSNVVATGSYCQGELPDLIERTGVNVILFSSTFPETFSYVMHEIIQLGLPVACFDRGAQKDCALGYRLGRVIPSQRPEVIWQTLCKLFEEVKAGV